MELLDWNTFRTKKKRKKKIWTFKKIEMIYVNR